MLVAFMSPAIKVLQYYFSGVKFRAKFEVLLQNNFGQSLPLKSLEIRLFYRKLNSRRRGNLLCVLHRNSSKYSNDQRSMIDSNFTARETQDSQLLQRHGYKQSSKLSTSKHSIEFTCSHFPCHVKVNSDKRALTSTFCRWKCKRGKRLKINANFQERNLCTALSAKKNPACGPYRKKLDRSRARD